jgi:hypothetical protein
MNTSTNRRKKLRAVAEANLWECRYMGVCDEFTRYPEDKMDGPITRLAKANRWRLIERIIINYDVTDRITEVRIYDPSCQDVADGRMVDSFPIIGRDKRERVIARLENPLWKWGH